ncbi:MAG: nucleotide-binding protein [Crenarchaeota archaeon]|nr:nucleotide-binding protein [Thermoproteota archaeon]
MRVILYHVYIEYSDPEKSGIRFNIQLEELIRTFVTPFNSSEPFWFMGRLLNPIKVENVLIFWSYEFADKIILPNQENLINIKDKKQLIEDVQKGKIKGLYLCTEKFLSPSLRTSVSTQNTSQENSSKNSIDVRNRIFVVSGSDSEMKQAITSTLRKLGLIPVIMQEQPSQGKKIIEQFAEYKDIGFAVVLLSPDDFGYPKDEPNINRKLRPTQNVVLGLGFLLGKIGKTNVLVFYKECKNFEYLNDFEDIKFTAFDDLGSWKLALIRELTNSNYTINKPTP